MKAKNAQRAAILVFALESIDNFVEQCVCPNSDRTNTGQLSIGEIGSTTRLGTPHRDAFVVVDLKTAELIGRAAKDIIREQIENMGVEI